MWICDCNSLKGGKYWGQKNLLKIETQMFMFKWCIIKTDEGIQQNKVMGEKREEKKA